MDSHSILQKAKEMFEKDYESEIKTSGILAPSINRSPLWPPWSVVEYAAMEQDTAKYFLYYGAIRLALRDLRKLESLKIIKVLIVGPGRGRLIDYVVDCLKEEKMIGVVHVIEANAACRDMLKEKYCAVTNVVIHSSLVIRDCDETIGLLNQEKQMGQLLKVSREKDVDLFVSELFGSFGDNEFMPEILKAAVNVFGSKNSVLIPESYTNYLRPIHSTKLEKFFLNIELENQTLDSVFILGLPDDTVYLSPSQALYHSNSSSSLSNVQGKSSFLLEDITARTGVEGGGFSLTGFAGHFKAVLYKDIYIDTRPGPTRNTYFWETAFFPLNSETKKQIVNVAVNPASETSSNASLRKLEVKLERVVRRVESKKRNHDGAVVKARSASRKPLFKLHYEWSIMSENNDLIGNVHNKNGCHHELCL